MQIWGGGLRQFRQYSAAAVKFFGAAVLMGGNPAAT